MKQEEILSRLKEAQMIIEECIAGLRISKSMSASRVSSIARSKPTKIDFSLNERNFVKTYSKGMNGEKKFVLLVAYLAKGKTNSDIETASVVSLWGRMTAKELLGYAYNAKYPTAAKTSGWIDSSKHGRSHLRASWTDIFA